jgi:hypothetical protein
MQINYWGCVNITYHRKRKVFYFLSNTSDVTKLRAAIFSYGLRLGSYPCIATDEISFLYEQQFSCYEVPVTCNVNNNRYTLYLK